MNRNQKRQRSRENSGRDDANFHSIESGRILSRTTTSEMMLRRWNESVWVRFGPTKILIFRSEKELDAWVASSLDGERPSLPAGKRLVQSTIDFDTLRTMKTPCQNHRHYGKFIVNKKNSSNKILPRVQKLKMTDVHTKLYASQVLHSFKVERLTDVGIDTIAAFASENPLDVARLRRAMQDCANQAIPPSKRDKLRRQNSDLARSVAPTEIISLASLSSSALHAHSTRR